MLLSALRWAAANPLEAGALFAAAIALARGIYLVIARLVAPYPRLRAAVEAFAALGPDVFRFFLQLARAVTGLPIPSVAMDSRDAALAARALAAERARDALMGSIARGAQGAPMGLPQPPAPPAEGGYVRFGAVVMLVILGAVVMAAGLFLAGCPASRQLARPALGPVDGCPPRATRCAPDGRPQVCSGSGRWTDADQVCTAGVNVAAVCCLTRSPVTGAQLHACVLADRCLPTDDAGAFR